MKVKGISEAKVDGRWYDVLGDYKFDGVNKVESGLKLKGIGNIPYENIQETR